MWLIGFLTALLTGFYTGRMWWIAFWGRPSPERPVEHPHEAPPVMMVPVLILAALTCVGGLLQVNAGFHHGWKLIEDFLAPTLGHLGWEERDLEYIPTAATLLLALATFFMAYRFYVSGAWKPWSAQVPFLQRLLERKYYFDEAYDALIVHPMDATAAGADQFLEEPVIDGAPGDVGLAAQAGAGTLSLTQTGYFRSYALLFLAGTVVALVVVILARTFG
jgi:NADH-quinone oxidoreductase subunit L